jgi:SAM-dependent methyltransferase
MIEWDRTLALNANTLARPRSRDAFTVTASTSANTFTEMNSVGLKLLSFFSEPATPGQAYEHFDRALGVTRAEFAAGLAEMMKSKLLVPGGAGPVTPAEFGNGLEMADPTVHQRLLRDQTRVLAYRAAIAQHVRGKSVLDLGCGTGIFSVLARQLGAARVVGIEESDIISVAKSVAMTNDSEVDFVRGNSLHVELQQRVDVILHELIGSDPFDEGMLRVVDDARERFLAPGGRLIPYRFEVASLGLASDAWVNRQLEWQEVRELGRTYGVDLQPLNDSMASRPWTMGRQVTRTVPDQGVHVLTEEALVYNLDLREDLGGVAANLVATQLKATVEGSLNSVAVYFRAHLDEQIVLSNSPLLPHTHWGHLQYDLPREIRVSPGDRVPLIWRIMTSGDRDRLTLTLPV